MFDAGSEDNGMGVHWLKLSVIGTILSFAAPVHASEQSRMMTREAYGLAYDLRFADSLALLEEATRADPSDPAPVRAAAAITWMEILFAQGVATFEAFVGQATGDVVERPGVPPHLARRFQAYIDGAVRLAEATLAARPQDVDAQYQAAASGGLLALYRGTVEGRTLAAFNEGRRAVALMERIRAGAPDHREAALIPGIYRYAVSTMSWPKRMLAAAAGMGGDRAGGIRLLEKAAGEDAETKTDAALVLMIIYNREGRHADALRHLRDMQARHPRNRLLRLNTAATALAASQPGLTVKAITAALPMLSESAEPTVAGERALWFYTRGTARGVFHDPAASEDLREAINAGPRDWVRARAHLELGRIALNTSQPSAAALELDKALHYARRAGDTAALEAAKHLRRAARKDPAP